MGSETVDRLKDGKIIYFAYFTFNEPECTTIIDQILFLTSLSHYGISELHIVLPYFPVGTMERIVGEGEISTAYSLAQMINNIPNGASKNKIYIFDIHALCSRFFFHTNTIPVLISMMPDYIEYIESFENTENINIIVFPDDGAKKRFEKLLPKEVKTILCSKTRKGNERIIRIDSGLEYLLDNSNKSKLSTKTINLFVIDDLVQSGGTLLKTCEGIIAQLNEYGNFSTTKIKFYPLVTHSIFPKPDNLTKFFKEQIYVKNSGNIEYKVEKLITTNSRPIRVEQIKTINESKYNDRIKITDISKPLFEIFTNSAESHKYIAPYSIH